MLLQHLLVMLSPAKSEPEAPKVEAACAALILSNVVNATRPAVPT